MTCCVFVYDQLTNCPVIPYHLVDWVQIELGEIHKNLQTLHNRLLALHVWHNGCVCEWKLANQFGCGQCNDCLQAKFNKRSTVGHTSVIGSREPRKMPCKKKPISLCLCLTIPPLLSSSVFHSLSHSFSCICTLDFVGCTAQRCIVAK